MDPYRSKEASGRKRAGLNSPEAAPSLCKMCAHLSGLGFRVYGLGFRV